MLDEDQAAEGDEAEHIGAESDGTDVAVKDTNRETVLWWQPWKNRWLPWQVEMAWSTASQYLVEAAEGGWHWLSAGTAAGRSAGCIAEIVDLQDVQSLYLGAEKETSKQLAIYYCITSHN